MHKINKIAKKWFLFMLSVMLFFNSTALTATASEKEKIKITSKIVDLGEFTLENSWGLSFFNAQNGIIELKNGSYEKWIDRIVVPQYALELYDTLVEYTNNDGVNDLLISKDGFSKENAYRIDYGIGIDTFNAIKVATLDNLTDAEINYVYKIIRAAYDAFIMDYPEVFWLSGKSSSYLVEYSYPNGKTSYEFYMLLKMHEGSWSDAYDEFLAKEYATEALIRDAIQKREQAVDKILKTPEVQNAKNDYELVKAFNEWLTKNNEYNTLVLNGDPYGTFDSHNCMSALLGREGEEGPVCESYTEAFKVLCDKKGIPCVHVTGRATSSPDSAGEAHSWNYVKIGNAWYGIDVTWNDPAVYGISGKVSGYENESYFLVGSKTQHSSMNFEDSHKLQNTVSSGDATAFVNGPVLSETAYQHIEVPEIPKTYTISWDIDGDGVVDDTEEYEYGEMPVHADGYKSADEKFEYLFKGWVPRISSVTADQTYTAQFETNEIIIEDKTAPEAPVYSKAPEINETSVTFSWKESSSNDVAYYELFNADTSEIFMKVTGATATITGLDVNKNYKIGVRAVDDAGNKSEALIYTVFIEKIFLYVISWDTDGDGIVDDTEEYEYGEMPVHADGYKSADEKYEYLFKGWVPRISSVTADQTYTAQFEANEIIVEDKTAPEAPVYLKAPEIDETSVTFLWKESSSDDVAYYELFNTDTSEIFMKVTGATATITGLDVNKNYKIGVRAVDEAGNKSEALIYTVFIEKIFLYVISWDTDGDGIVDDTKEYEYGEMPVHADGYKPADSKYTYTFTGWNPEITNVTGDQTYIAQFEAEEIITEPEVPVDPEIPADPEKPAMNEIIRLSGSTRYDTGYAVANTLKEAIGVDKFEAVVVATGKNFADALAGSYLAVEKNAPILLTNGKEDNIAQLHAYIKDNVAENGVIYILGGEGAVPASVDQISGYVVKRLYGSSRYDTNIAILNEAGVTGDSIIVATGKTFADSLSASAAKLPILLVKPNAALNEAQIEILEGMKNIYIVGGEGAVSLEYTDALKGYGTVTRVSGASRYDTSVEIAKTFCSDAGTAVIASGKNFPDGLCGGPLAAVLNAPLILTKDGGADAAAAFVSEKAIEGGYVLGGSGALADTTVKEVFSIENAN